METEAECYRILGIEPGATMEQLRAAYRRAACKYHPDLQDGDNPAAEQKLRELIVAYKFLARRLDPAAWAHRGGDRKTYTPQDFAREGYRLMHVAGAVLDFDEPAGLLEPRQTRQSYATRDETRTFVCLWALSIVAGVFVAGFVAAWRLHRLGGDELPPSEVSLTLIAALGIYILLAVAAVVLVILTRKIISVTLRLTSRWLFLPGPKPDHALPEQAKKIDQTDPEPQS